jgi:hypothetical protein
LAVKVNKFTENSKYTNNINFRPPKLGNTPFPYTLVLIHNGHKT